MELETVVSYLPNRRNQSMVESARKSLLHNILQGSHLESIFYRHKTTYKHSKLLSFNILRRGILDRIFMISPCLALSTRSSRP